MRVRRVGSRGTFALRARPAVRAALMGAETYDVVVEDINKLPLYLPSLTDAAVLRHRAAPLRDDGVRGGELAGGRGRVGGRAR